MYDDVYVHIITADETAASNGLVAKGAIRIHKVVVEAATSNAVSALALHDAATVTGDAKIGITTNEVTATIYTRYAEANFSPQVRFQVGLSINVTGTLIARIYYSR